MKIVKIPKKTKGQFREIAIPSPEEKYFYRKRVHWCMICEME
jgi:hypothetical protein